MSHPFAASVQRHASSLLTFTILLPFLSQNLVARTQPPAPPFVQAKDRITSFIDDEQRVTLRGNVHPLAASQYDAGAVAPGFSMEHMLLTLLPDAAQLDALNQLLDARHNPSLLTIISGSRPSSTENASASPMPIRRRSWPG